MRNVINGAKTRQQIALEYNICTKTILSNYDLSDTNHF